MTVRKPPEEVNISTEKRGNSDEVINKKLREARELLDESLMNSSLVKSHEIIQKVILEYHILVKAEEDKVNHMNKVKAKLEQSLDEMEDNLEREKRVRQDVEKQRRKVTHQSLTNHTIDE